jgi:hypothetical protein
MKKRLEFDLPQEVIQLVYQQALIWFGMAFCPVLPVFGFTSNMFSFCVHSKLVSLKGFYFILFLLVRTYLLAGRFLATANRLDCASRKAALVNYF